MAIVIQKEQINTVHRIHNLIEDKILCSKNKDRETLVSKIDLPTLEIDAAYLLLSFTRSTEIDIVKWKIALNNVILTREFKPHVDVSLNDSYIQSVFVYDVSKILNSTETMLKISCGAKGYVYLDGATLITLLHYKKFNTQIYCEVDPYVFNTDGPLQKIFNVIPSFKINETSLHVGIVAPSNSWLTISTHSNEKKFNLFRGYNVVEVKLGSDPVASINIHGANKNLRYLFSCLTCTYSEFPKIVVDNLQITDSIIRFRIANIGDSKSDRIELLILRHGVPIQKTILKPLEPQEHIDYEINIDNLKQSYSNLTNIVLRILWSKAYKIYEYDVPIKINSENSFIS